MKKYNIYCDESCHLEHDKERVMVIGGTKCLQSERKRVCKEIIEIKKRYGISEMAEIKWNKVAPCNVEYFRALVDYFFSCDNLEFRAVIVDKTKLIHNAFQQTHDEFYYKMYFYCLSGLVSTRGENYIYLDKKDTRGTRKIQGLKLYLSRKTHDFDQSKIKQIQCVNSRELPILQLTDLLIGAIGYHNRLIERPSEAKLEIIHYIQQVSKYSLEKSTYLSEKKFNLFFINLQSPEEVF